MDFIIEFLSNTLGVRLASFLGSMIPLIELKGSIMFARGASLGFFEAFLYSYLGSTAVFFFLFFLLKPILNLLKKWKPFYRLASAVEEYFSSKAEDEENKIKGDNKAVSSQKKMLAVFIFVAIPLPMTGVWTGSAIAVFLGLSFKQAVLPVTVGNLVAGLIISVLAELFLPYVDIILYALLAVALVMLIIFIVKLVLKAKQIEKED